MTQEEARRALRAHIQEGLSLNRIPETMWDAFDRYFLDHIKTGSFLEALLSNDFLTACSRADWMNKDLLFNYAVFISNYAPPGSFGSPEAYRNWVSKRTPEPPIPEEGSNGPH